MLRLPLLIIVLFSLLSLAPAEEPPQAAFHVPDAIKKSDKDWLKEYEGQIDLPTKPIPVAPTPAPSEPIPAADVAPSTPAPTATPKPRTTPRPAAKPTPAAVVAAKSSTPVPADVVIIKSAIPSSTPKPSEKPTLVTSPTPSVRVASSTPAITLNASKGPRSPIVANRVYGSELVPPKGTATAISEFLKQQLVASIKQIPGDVKAEKINASYHTTTQVLEFYAISGIEKNARNEMEVPVLRLTVHMGVKVIDDEQAGTRKITGPLNVDLVHVGWQKLDDVYKVGTNKENVDVREAIDVGVNKKHLFGCIVDTANPKKPVIIDFLYAE